MKRVRLGMLSRKLAKWCGVALGLPFICALSQQSEDILNTFHTMRPQTSDFGSYALHELKVDNPSSRYDGVEVIWVNFPKASVEIFLQNVDEHGVANEIYTRSTSSSDLVLLSAGFHDSNDRPVGLFISGGRQLSGMAPWNSGGMLFERQGSIGIIPVKGWHMEASDVSCAIQTKPLLVENGSNGVYSDDGYLSDRVGIGFTADGDLMVAGAFRAQDGRALSLYDFGRLMAIPAKDGGPDARTFLGLEGGPGAHIYFPLVKQHFGQSGPGFVMNAIHVRMRGN